MPGVEFVNLVEPDLLCYNMKNEFVLDKDSKIELNGKESVGKKKIDIDALFY